MSPAAGPFATCSTRFFERSAAGAMAALFGEDGGKLTPAALERLEAILAQARTKFQKGRCLMLELRVVLGMTLLTICAAARWSAGPLPNPTAYGASPFCSFSSSPFLQVQRFVVWVGSAEAPQPSLPWPSAQLLFALWLSGTLGVAGWWLLGFVRLAGILAASKEHSTHAGVAVRTCAGLRTASC